MKAEDFRPMFLAECADHLDLLERFVGTIAQGGLAADQVDAAFRAIHSIKGGAGMFGLDRIVPISHALESHLDDIREDSGRVTEDHAAALVKCVDCLTDLIEAETKGFALPAGFENLAMERLARFARVEAAEATLEDNTTGADEFLAVAKNTFDIIFNPHSGLLRRANEPLIIIRELRDIGRLQVRTDCSAIPDLENLNPTDSYLRFEFLLETDNNEAEVRKIFEFVEGDCDLNIILRSADATAVTEPAASPALATPEPDPTLATLAEQRIIDASVTSIRVETEKIDRLVNLVGEIAISQALVTQLIDQSLFNANPRLFQELSQLLVHTQTLHDTVMSVRAQPVRTVFQRMPRLVRELGEQLGKRIILRMSGEATEIDKTVVEQLADPIVHMLRNAADHGLETPSERLAAGKSPDGLITLHAEQRGSRIIIEISDDGRGLDRDKVKATAIARGLLAADATLAAEEIDNLIFLPGFTTSQSVTHISGRGVGLDVVKQNVLRFGGRVGLRSVPGQGIKMTMSLPLTLAVLEGLIVRCGAENYVIPVASVLECRSNWKAQARRVPGHGHVLEARGRMIAVHQLTDAFGIAGDAAADGGVAILVDLEGRDLAVLVADEITGQQQVVVKKLAGTLGAIPGIAGATILGDGRVALILDPSEVASVASRKPHDSGYRSGSFINSGRLVA